nr:M56 family metallopeptidase [Lachnospiraceae bacterium]
SYMRLRIHVRTAVLVKREAGRRSIPVLESEWVDSPFVLGLICPRVYLPAKVGEEDRNYIISHELAHIHRKDHWIKPFGYLLLAAYWFHPLLWIAYIMLCRDIEYACDERVVKRYDVEERKAYSTALLTCSVRRFRIAACPVAFGEVGVRQRIKGVLHYKKPAFWVLLAGALSLVIVAVCFLTNPKSERDVLAEDGSVSETADAGDVSGASETADAGGGSNPAGAAVPADGWYEYDHCVYMNPLSSYFPVEGQRIGGYLEADGLIWNELGRQECLLFEQAPAEYNADTVSWSFFNKEELEVLFDGIFLTNDGMEAELDRIGTLPAEKRLWRPLEDGSRLLYVDGELWLLRHMGGGEVWSIYALRLESSLLDDAIAKAAWDWAEETGAFGGVTRTEAAAEGVTGELWAMYPCVSYVVLATEGAMDAAGDHETLTVYAQVLATAYLCEQTGLTELGGSYVPAAITFLVNEDGSYTLSEYWTPRDGSYFVQDIREKASSVRVADAMIDGQRYIYELMQDSYARAVSETGVVDTRFVVGDLFDRMQEDRDDLLEEDADAVKRMAAYPLTVRELYYYGDNTLRYIYNQFLRGGESGLRGELMARVLHQMTLEEMALRMPLTDGQAYFDALVEITQKTYADLVQSEGGEAQAKQFMREFMPAGYLLLSMLELRTSDVEAGQDSAGAGNVGAIAAGLADAEDIYEYYLTKEELMADIDRGYLFRLDTTFQKTKLQTGNVYTAPYVSMGIWPFYVHEDNIVNLEIAFSDLIRKPNKNIFPEEERIIVEVVSPDGQSVYRFEKVGDEITKDTSVQEQIPVTPGEWTLKVSFAYVCGEAPAHLKIAAVYENPTEEDLNWLKEERLANREGL